jgi:two-component system nitrate/nitrite response regulator NarL
MPRTLACTAPALNGIDLASSPSGVATAARPVRIVIADPYPILRAGLRRLLETDPGLRIVGETGDGSAVVALVQALRPDILLLGLPSTDAAWVLTLGQLADAGAEARTILLAKSIDTPELRDAFQLGAYGILTRDSPADVLFKSIESVTAGHCWVGHECAFDVVASIRRLDNSRRRAQVFGLTRRELEIVRAVMGGDTNKQIARRFSISENTVKRHLTHIFNKVGASSRVELALFSAHHRLLEHV